MLLWPANQGTGYSEGRVLTTGIIVYVYLSPSFLPATQPQSAPWLPWPWLQPFRHLHSGLTAILHIAGGCSNTPTCPNLVKLSSLLPFQDTSAPSLPPPRSAHFPGFITEHHSDDVDTC